MNPIRHKLMIFMPTIVWLSGLALNPISLTTEMKFALPNKNQPQSANSRAGSLWPVYAMLLSNQHGFFRDKMLDFDAETFGNA